MLKQSSFWLGSLSMMVLLSGCGGTAMSQSINASGAKEYHLTNKYMIDYKKNKTGFNNLQVQATYDYVEKSDTVKITLTNVGNVLIGGVDGSDAMIKNFTLYVNNIAYQPTQCDQPNYNGSFDDHSHVENSLACTFPKEVLSQVNPEGQISYHIDFYRPNTGDIHTIKAALANPVGLNRLQCTSMGFNYDQCVVWSLLRMPAKQFSGEVMHSAKDQKTNLAKFGTCIQNDRCQ